MKRNYSYQNPEFRKFIREQCYFIIPYHKKRYRIKRIFSHIKPLIVSHKKIEIGTINKSDLSTILINGEYRIKARMRLVK